MITDIVIPVRDQLQYTESICRQLSNMDGWRHCWVFDNGSEDDTWEWLKQWCKGMPKFSCIPAKGLNIYEMWDWGFDAASNADHLLYLNNDVELHPSTIVALNAALESQDSNWIAYPDYNCPEQFGNMCNYRVTSGTYRHGGMSGFCFMIKRNKIDWSPLVDPAFKLWYGDDDIAFEVAARHGRQVRVVGLPIVHIGQATTNAHPELFEHIPRDREAFVAKWGNR